MLQLLLNKKQSIYKITDRVKVIDIVNCKTGYFITKIVIIIPYLLITNNI